MAFVKVIGFETGDLSQSGIISGTGSVQSTIKRTGGYALKINPASSSSYITIDVLSQYAARFYFYAVSLPSSPEIGFAVDTDAVDLLVFVNGDGSLEAKRGGTSKGISAAISTGTWYRIDIKASSGAWAISLNGTEFATDNQAANPVALLLGKVVDSFGASVEFYYDDVLINNSAATYPLGAGQSIARQPGAGLGTPTYNAWTKSTGTDAGALWDNTPFTTGDYCSTASSAAAQTSFVSPFSTGTNAIGASDTINACQVALIAKTSATSSGGTNCNIRRRVNAADTTLLLVLTTSDAYYQETTLWTATRAQLDAMEAGATSSASTRVRTVEDVWVFVDYSLSGSAASLTGQGATTAQGTLTPLGGSITAALTGVQATGAQGTFTSNHAQTLTGQGLVSAQGIVTASSTTAGTSVALTGLQATAATGGAGEYVDTGYWDAGYVEDGTAAALRAALAVTPSGQQAATAQGNLTAVGGGVSGATLAGLQVTGAQGSFTPSLSVPIEAGELTLGGLAAIADAGTLAVRHSNALVGQAASTQQGTLSASRAVILTGQAVTVAQGSLAVLHSNAIVGQTVTVAQGTLSASSAGAAVLTGQAAVTQQGAISTSHAQSLSGQAATASAGSVTANRSSGALTGQQVTATAGNLGTQHSQALAGQVVTAQLGTISAVHTNTGTLTGLQVATAVGTLGTTLHSNALTGQQATAVQGTASAGSAGVSTLNGQQATASQGTLRPDHSNAIAGLQATSALGTVTGSQSLSPTLTGQQASVALGTLGTQHSNALTGQQGATAAGSHGTQHSNTLTGQQATTAAGTLAAGSAGAATLTGQAGTVTAGSPGTQHSQALTGQPVTASQGQISAIVAAGVTLTGQAVSTAGGNVAPRINVTLTGQAATAQQGDASVSIPGAATFVGQQATTAAGTLFPELSVPIDETHGVELVGQQCTAEQGELTPFGGTVLVVNPKYCNHGDGRGFGNANGRQWCNAQDGRRFRNAA